MWSLDEFERKVYLGEREGAAQLLLILLMQIDANYGNFGNIALTTFPQNSAEDYIRSQTLTRLTSAITALLANPEFQFSITGLGEALNRHRWLSAIFSATPLLNADHILRIILQNPDPKDGLVVPLEQLNKFCLLYSPDSAIPMNLDQLYSADPMLAIGLGMALISPRFLGTELAHIKRNNVLQWLAPRLLTIDNIDTLPVSIVHDVYMHCSYADIKNRHDIKRSINKVIVKSLKIMGLENIERRVNLANKSKPVMLVVLEWFNKGHSIYRTHSQTMEAAKEHFQMIAIAYPNQVDEVTRKVFEEVIDLNPALTIAEQLQTIQNISNERNAQILYMPSVGMFPLTMFLCNLRVAPLQVMALGHPATTHSDVIDYVVVEEDYVGDPNCFSEQLMKLPKDGMPYRKSEAIDSIVPLYLNKGAEAEVDIVVCATTMKLNPEFLKVCAAIAEGSKKKVRFHFLVGQAIGLIHASVTRFIYQYLGGKAVVYGHQPYPDYIGVIAKCDLFLNPFPFGNTNGVIDTVSAGLVGICKTGDEVFEHIDQGLFERLNFPDWMIAKTNEEYIAAAIRLIDNKRERVSLRKNLTGDGAIQTIFNGRPEIMGRLLHEALVLRSQE
jgi:hypothetical protein